MTGFRNSAGVVLMSVALAVTAAALDQGGFAFADATDRPVVVLSPLAARGQLAPTDRYTSPVPAGSGSTVQSISVIVAPGPLMIMRAPDRVVLTRVPGTTRFHATVRAIRVVDTRGRGEGWHLRGTLLGFGGRSRNPNDVQFGALRVHVDRVVALADSTAGIHARPTTRLRASGPTWLVAADPGSGNGAFDVTVQLEVDAPGVGARHLIGHLSFDVS